MLSDTFLKMTDADVVWVTDAPTDTEFDRRVAAVQARTAIPERIRAIPEGSDCRGCGWKAGPARKFYCRACDPTAARECRADAGEKLSLGKRA